eukprot:jgi/Mesvir1/9856/Mv22392-RA.1
MDWASFGVSFGLNAALLFGFFVLFLVLRRVNKWAGVYFPRQASKGENTSALCKENWLMWLVRMLYTDESELREAMGLDAVMFMRTIKFGIQLFLGVSFFCILIILPVNLTGGGVEKAIRMGTPTATDAANDTFTPSPNGSPDNAPSLVPEPQGGTSTSGYSDFDKLSLSNIQQRSPRLWAHLVAVWGVSLYTFYLLHVYYQRYRADRVPLDQLFASQRESAEGGDASTGQSSREVSNPSSRSAADTPDVPTDAGAGLLRVPTLAPLMPSLAPVIPPFAPTLEMEAAKRIAKEALNKVTPFTFDVVGAGAAGRARGDSNPYGTDADAFLFEYFNELFPGTVHSASVARNPSTLGPLAASLDAAERSLERARVTQWRDKGRRPTHRPRWFSRNKVDSIQFYADEIVRLRHEIQMGVGAGMLARVMPAGFVGFRSRAAAANAAQCLLNEDPHRWETEMAPHPAGVLWHHLVLSHADRSTRRKLTAAIMFAIVVFYVIPVTAVSGFVSLSYLEENFAWVKSITQIDFLRAVLTAFLPGLVLKLFMLLLPSLCMWLASMEGGVSFSSAEVSAFAKYFVFIVVNIWFASAVGVSVFASINEMVDHPDQIHLFLAASIPGSANLFINYMLVSIALMPLELVDPVGLLWYLFKSRLLCFTERDHKEACAPPRLPYHSALPNELMTILLGIIYCNINPIILPLCIVRLAVGYLVWTNQILRKYNDPFDNGGRIWPKVHHRVLVSLAIWQVTMAGLFAINLKPAPAILTIPMLLGTLVFHLWSKDKYGVKDDILPMDVAVKLDRNGLSDDMEVMIRDAYWPTPLKESSLACLHSKQRALECVADMRENVPCGSFGQTPQESLP